MPPFDAGIEDERTAQERCAAFRAVGQRLREAVGRRLVGQQAVVDQVLWSLFAGGHVLLEGVPGLGKTLLVRTLGDALHLDFARIQFTPDLMPADIVGTQILVDDGHGHRVMQFRPGPIFTQVLLADEVNRASPKSQSALLEAMQERAVTVGGHTHRLRDPFLVLATQNPIEQEGTYPLPEAQLDRFLLKVSVPNVERADLMEILRRTTTSAEPAVDAVLDGARIVQAQRLARRIVIAAPVKDYVIRLVLATHPGGEHADGRAAREIAVGASPRAAQAIVTAAKVRALFDGRFHVSIGDVHAVAPAALRHRVIPSFEAEADGLDADRVVAGIIERLPRHAPEEAA
ncbi:MAG: AAA family ATPase [Phycisphaerales bacterium]|nr:AAA family ATPase [Phycisphaerales bacterium]